MRCTLFGGITSPSTPNLPIGRHTPTLHDHSLRQAGGQGKFGVLGIIKRDCHDVAEILVASRSVASSLSSITSSLGPAMCERHSTGPILTSFMLSFPHCYNMDYESEGNSLGILAVAGCSGPRVACLVPKRRVRNNVPEPRA